ncbi:MAG: hypothetical protein ABJO01_12465 [Parasphingorhabdus sp.]|uniref:hypothetical protein n=1 Tax=Parasphingorhabdus sp. TaxID=2709688 RepID=UPI003299FABA
MKKTLLLSLFLTSLTAAMAIEEAQLESVQGKTAAIAEVGKHESNVKRVSPVVAGTPAPNLVAQVTSIPEPSNVIMLALGVAGLVAGRLVARKKKNKL